jgi:hypothetical protein
MHVREAIRRLERPDLLRVEEHEVLLSARHNAVHASALMPAPGHCV